MIGFCLYCWCELPDSVVDPACCEECEGKLGLHDVAVDRLGERGHGVVVSLALAAWADGQADDLARRGGGFTSHAVKILRGVAERERREAGYGIEQVREEGRAPTSLRVVSVRE